MTTSVKQVAIVMGQHIQTPWQPQIKNLQQKQKKNQREKNKCIPLNENIKTQRKRLKDTKNKELLIQKQPENKKKNGSKYTPINNHFKCQWTRSSNQKGIYGS